MLLVRQNPKGGWPLKGYPLDADPETGSMGYKVGYCSCGCKQPILIRLGDLRDIVDEFGLSAGLCVQEEPKQWLVSPIPALKKRIVESLGGTYTESEKGV